MPDFSFPPVGKKASIGLLGGSFDPPHLGHALLALSFLTLEPVDEIWVIPCGDHAFKGELTCFQDRLRMCELTFRNIKNLRVIDIENKLKAPNYTVNTIDHIVSNRPDLKLYLALGSDLIDDFHQWHKPEEILKKTTLVIFERTTSPIKSLPRLLDSAHIHQGYTLPGAKSTDVRNLLAKNQLKACAPLMDRHVLDYIKSHKLYGIA